MLATIRYDRGQGDAALYVRARNVSGEYREFSAGAWVTSETSACRVFLSEAQDADTVESRYSASYTLPSGDVVIEYVLLADGSVIGEETFSAAAEVVASLTGSGSSPVTVRATDGTNPVAGVQVQAWQGGNLLALAMTNAAGEVLLSLPAGTLDIVITKGGYVYPRTEVVVSGAQTVTVAGAPPSSPPAPSDPALCLLYENLRNQDGTPAAGVAVEVKIIGLPADYDGALYSGAKVSDISDAVGYVSWLVPRTAKVAVSSKTFGLSKSALIPDAATARIGDLV